MKDTDLKRYQAKLLQIRDRTRVDVHRMMDIVLDDAQSAGEHDRHVSESVDKEIVLENTEAGIRDAVTAALDRIDQGTYGVCQDCGKNIPLQRLNLVPYTPYCVACERNLETAK